MTGLIYGGDRTRRVWETLIRATPPAPGRASGLPPAAYLPELDMLVQVFPFDHALPAIADLVAGPPPELAAAITAVFGAGDWRLEGWRAEPVRYRVDHRVALRVDAGARDAASGRTAKRSLFVKAYRLPEESREAYERQRAVAASVAAAGSPFVVAEPLAHSEALRAFVQTEVGGTTLQSIIRQERDPTAAARGAAQVVARFHQLPVDAPPRQIEEDIARLGIAQDRLSIHHPDLAPGIAETIQAIADGLVGVATGPTHGDLKPDHLLFDGDRIALIDFDLMRADDPVRDVANLVLHLAKKRPRAASRGGQAGTVAQAFLDEYFAHVPEPWRQRLPLHQAMVEIDKASALARTQPEGWRERSDDLLRTAHAQVTAHDQ